MNSEQTFGEQVRRLRRARGMSQADFARALADTGVPPHQSTIAKIEAGDRPLRLNEACRIAAALGSDLNSLIGDVGVEPDAAVLVHLARIAELEGVIASARRALAKAGGVA